MTIADDYSDPFDAKNDLKNKAGKGESAGYMEPYEAQRIMTGKQSPWHRGLQLSRGGKGDPWSSASLLRGRDVLSRCWLKGSTVVSLNHSLSVLVSPTSGRTWQVTVTFQIPGTKYC